MKKFIKFIIIMVVSVSLLALPSVLFADNLVADGDNLVPVASNDLALGDISQGASASGGVLLAIKKVGGGNVYANSAIITVSSTDSAHASATMPDTSITLPSNWTGEPNNTMSTDTASSTVTVNTTGQSTGSYSETVGYSASGADSGGGTLTRPANLTVTWTVVGPSDSTAPTTTIGLSGTAGLAGWYISDVGVTLTATDTGGSGVKEISYVLNSGSEVVVSGATASFTISTEGTNTLEYWAVDNADNVETPHNSQEIKIDKTDPVITITAPANGAKYILNQVVNANWSATDAISGIASSSGTVPSGEAIDTSSIESKSFKVDAEDNAGNTATLTVTYSVIYEWLGFLQPINLDGTSKFKQGSTIPVKFRIGGHISTAIANISVERISGADPGPVNEVVSTSAATTGTFFRYSSTDDLYIFNLSTKNLITGQYIITADLGDGEIHTVEIGIK